MNNRCKRCNRELSDPNADYGWRCAQILGVSNQLSKMRPEAFERFLSGITKADKLMGNADFNSEQKNGMYKSYAKMALWDGIDKNKVAEAKKDSFAAAGGRKSNTNLAEELSEWGKNTINKISSWGEDKANETIYNIRENGLIAKLSRKLDDLGVLDDAVNGVISAHDSMANKNPFSSDSKIGKLYQDAMDSYRKKHKKLGDENYETNKSVPLNTYDNDFINDQNDGQVKELRYGKWNMENNGCEVIAVYNSLRTLGKPEDIRDIAKYFENDGQIAWGYGGTNPYATERYFKSKGFKVKTIIGKENIMDNEPPKADTYIMTVVNDRDVMWGLHTVSFEKTKYGNYKFYNYDLSYENYNNRSSAAVSLNSYLKRQDDVPLILFCISK